MSTSINTKNHMIELSHSNRFSNDYNLNNIISESFIENRFNSKNDYCDITINVKHIKYGDDTEYYYINYDNVFSKNHIDKDYIDDSHPLYNYHKIISKNILHYNIITKNSMTTEMIKYLLMDYDELELHCGNNSPEFYKKGIMIGIAQLCE